MDFGLDELVRREKPMDVIIIGGSLAGLMHGIMIKRLGHSVRIVDQNPSSFRTDHAAGMGTGPQGLDFLQQYDLCKTSYSFASPGFQYLDKDGKIKRLSDIPLNLTRWTVLYYRLRANFDAFRSDYCLEPPQAAETDGKAVYEVGKRATNVAYAGDLVTVELDDIVNGGHIVTHANFVIVADGSYSTIRQKMLPNIRDRYSGYVAWRGIVPEKNVSRETQGMFDEKFTVFEMKRGYIVGYAIPGENGNLEKGCRSLNFVWYHNYPEDSPEFITCMTDTDGHRHRSTLPSGKMRPETRAILVELANKLLNPPFRELVAKTTNPFISTVRDCASPQAAFFDGKLLLVGEALTLLRPHIGMAFNYSAMNCLLLRKVLEGEMTISQWEHDVQQHTKTTKLYSIAFGSFYQYGVLSPAFIRDVVKWIFALVMQRVANIWRIRTT